MGARNSSWWTCAKRANGPGDTSPAPFIWERASSSATPSSASRIPTRNSSCIAAAGSVPRWRRRISRKWVTRTSSRWTADGRAGSKQACPSPKSDAHHSSRPSSAGNFPHRRRLRLEAASQRPDNSLRLSLALTPLRLRPNIPRQIRRYPYCYQAERRLDVLSWQARTGHGKLARHRPRYRRQARRERRESRHPLSQERGSREGNSRQSARERFGRVRRSSGLLPDGPGSSDGAARKERIRQARYFCEQCADRPCHLLSGCDGHTAREVGRGDGLSSKGLPRRRARSSDFHARGRPDYRHHVCARRKNRKLAAVGGHGLGEG